MTNLTIYKESSNRTLSSAQKLGHYFMFAACALTLSTSHASIDPKRNNLESKEAVTYNSDFDFDFIQTSSVRDLSFKKGGVLPISNLDWIDAEIDTFMTSLSIGEEIAYSDELLEMAEKIINNNPQSFKNFL